VTKESNKANVMNECESNGARVEAMEEEWKRVRGCRGEEGFAKINV